jgi:hypothetical protein
VNSEDTLFGLKCALKTNVVEEDQQTSDSKSNKKCVYNKNVIITTLRGLIY